VLVQDALSGAVLHQVTLGEPPLGEYEDACTFHGSSQFALGWGYWGMDRAPGVGLDVYDLATGALAGRHRTRRFSVDSLGDQVGDIESMPGLGRLAYSLRHGGIVALLDDSTWKQVGSMDFNGGNQRVLELSHAVGSERLFLSGVTPTRARMVGARALEQRAKDEVTGLFGLCESPNGAYVLGRSNGRVQVLDGASLELLYERQELTGPGTRLIRARDTLADSGVGPSATQDCHLERDGSSHPIACFDAWLDDPLGLARVTLEHLPQPPRLDAGPARVVRAAESSVTLRFRAVDEGGLVGAWVIVAGRAPRFLSGDDTSVDEPTALDWAATIEGPWPLDVELVGVGTTGLESKPWRVRIVQGE
jgi:hypothetical protein